MDVERATKGIGTVLAAFSSGRDRDLAHRFEDALADLTIHDLHRDVDANRLWLAASGDPGRLVSGLMACFALAADRIDLTHHVGAVSRTGALDRVLCFGSSGSEVASQLGQALGESGVPVFGTGAEERWEALHDAGFGSLLDRQLYPDFGPETAHPALGISLVAASSWRFLVALDVQEERADFCSLRVRDIRNRRLEGDGLFQGVDAVAYPAPSDGCSRLLLEFGQPDEAPADPVLEWVTRRAKGVGLAVRTPRLIGAIRQVDLLETRTLPVRPEQVVRE